MTELELARTYLQDRSLSTQKPEVVNMITAGVIHSVIPADEVDAVLELVSSGMFEAFHRQKERYKIARKL